MKLLKKEEQQHTKDKAVKDEEMRRTLYSIGKTVGNRNPMSRGQGYSGDSKVAVLQMMLDDD